MGRLSKPAKQLCVLGGALGLALVLVLIRAVTRPRRAAAARAVLRGRRPPADQPDAGLPGVAGLRIEGYVIVSAVSGAMGGSAFALYTGLGAKLQRSLINFCLDRGLADGYEHSLSLTLPGLSTLVFKWTAKE